MNESERLCAIVRVLVAVATLTCGSFGHAAEVCPDTSYITDDPSLGDWIDNVQGVAHDDGYWFFSTQSDPWIIKLPATYDFADEFSPGDPDEWPPGAQVVGMPSSLESLDFEDFKDLDQSRGFLFVPVVGEGKSGIAVFRTTDLAYYGFYSLSPYTTHSSFLAWSETERLLYATRSVVGDGQPLFRFRVNFDALRAGNVADAFTFHSERELFDYGGERLSPALHHMQGAAFTPWGDLYLVNGYDSLTDHRPGIHLFDSNGVLLEESTNGYGDFNFAWDPDETGFEGEEPEGADWWDAAAAGSHIQGPLHVILLDNDDLDDDGIYFKHYDVDYGCLGDQDWDGDGLIDRGEINVTHTNPKRADSEDDGLGDRCEIEIGTDPWNPDTDGDGILDSLEDSDGDHLTDGDECREGTNPFDPDTDHDGLPDGEEIRQQTNPRDPDSDGDGLKDGDEIVDHGTDPRDADSDNDGLDDGDEVLFHGTNPNHPDTDADGLTDFQEIRTYGTDPLDADSDNDGLSDGEEIDRGTDPRNFDTDGDNLSDGDEVHQHGTDPLDTDSDDDGLSDGDEVLNFGTDPLDPDTDGDGLTDGDEVLLYGTDPLNPDTDDDKLPDGAEVDYGTDPSNPDSDGDGLMDGEDPDFVATVVEELDERAFKGTGHRASSLAALDRAERHLSRGQDLRAISALVNFRRHVDGCGARADLDDWIESCPEQIDVREALDLLIGNASP